MISQSSIESRLAVIEKFFWLEYPLCLCCGHKIRDDGQLAHIIRRSNGSAIYSREQLQTMKLNTGLAHESCHKILDDNPQQAIYLPRFNEIHFIMWIIDPSIFREVAMNVYPFYEFPDFEAISNKYALHLMPPRHHGELLHLPMDI